MEYRHVRFLPWVGEKYWEEETRILVVGVKHYGGDPLAFSTHANIECVNSSLYNKNVEGFFDTFERTINVIRHEDETSEETWGRIAFCNYLQEVLATANSFPTAGQILNSQDAYRNTRTSETT